MFAVNVLCFYASSTWIDVRNRYRGGLSNVANWTMGSSVVQKGTDEENKQCSFKIKTLVLVLITGFGMPLSACVRPICRMTLEVFNLQKCSILNK
jgi:hypothetical protein